MNNRLITFGISHKTSDVSVREKFQLGRKELPSVLDFLLDNGIEGALALSTCNRIEFYLSANEDFDAFELFEKYYLKERHISLNAHRESFYLIEGDEVTRHLFRVISGLESLITGEYQIQGQVKEAYSIACNHKAMDKLMHKLLHAAFRAGKKVRSQTETGEGKISVSGIASQILKENLKPDETLTLIGVNDNTRIVAKALHEAGFKNFNFVNRTQYKAEMLAVEYKAKAFGLDGLEIALSESAAVYTSTGAPGYVIEQLLLQKLIREGKCPRLLIDMAVPRDIDASGLPEYIRVWDIGSLKEYLNDEQSRRLKDLPRAEAIIEDEANIFKAWSDARKNNLLEPYAEKFEQIRCQLVEENKAHFTESELEKIDKFSKSLTHRMQSTFMRILIKKCEEQQKAS
ncbi:MAG: glutamyl-tRNA reductase [Candidatus Kapaibacterium sp.]